jgi:hypothetical protein
MDMSKATRAELEEFSSVMAQRDELLATAESLRLAGADSEAVASVVRAARTIENRLAGQPEEKAAAETE